MAGERILIVEDEVEIRELLSYRLAREGFVIDAAESASEALKALSMNRPDLVLLDLMLPDQDGFELCRRLKRHAPSATIPVIMLTAKGEDADVVSGLELGADDYITKPFSPRVLLARLRAVLRRGSLLSVAEGDTIRLHDMEIDPRRHEVRIGDRAVVLTATEFRVLLVLVQRPGWVLSRAQIAGAVHGDGVVGDRAIDVHIVGLRRKLGEAGQHIETIRGVGYRFRD